MKILFDIENNKSIGKFNTDKEWIELITKFLKNNCQWEFWISDLEIEANLKEFDTLEKQCIHYNFIIK